jgi:putative spermidine/putrescine transport system ATP-binding protein
MKRISKADIATRVLEMLRIVGLEEKIKSYPHELSGGQQQRVALARSLAVHPKLMLMDEPLSALDAKIRRNLRLELRRIQKSLGMTTIFVTHDQEEALTISDRVCVMHQGQIVQIGTPEEIYTNPRDEFVARFIGNYNVLNKQELERFTGRLERKGDCFAIRPEAIRLVSVGSEQKWLENEGLEAIGRIDEVIVLGNVLRFNVHVQDVMLTVDALNGSERLGLETGSEVKLWIPHEACKILN